MDYSAALPNPYGTCRWKSRRHCNPTAILVHVAMLIADTNPHSSTVDEDGNERVAGPMLSGMVSEDNRGHVGA